MPGRTVAGCWNLRAGVVMVLGLLMVFSGHSVLANDEDSTPIGIGVVTDATPDDDLPPPASDPSLPAEEATPGDISNPETSPPVLTPTADPEQGGEAVAPGTVTVVLWTSDHTPLPERATICVGDVCQSGSQSRSGASFWFDEVRLGWQQVTLRIGAPYGESTVPVLVRAGTNNQVEVTLVPEQQMPGERLDPTPAPAERPVESIPPAQETVGSSVAVSALPSTGAASAPAALPLVLGTLAMVLAVAAGGMLVSTRS